jgi:transposase-like protein
MTRPRQIMVDGRSQAAKHFVAKVVKTFGPGRVIAESLDDFRYGKCAKTRRKNPSRRSAKRRQHIAHGVLANDC